MRREIVVFVVGVDGSFGVDDACWSSNVVRMEGEEIVTRISTASSVSTTRFSTTSSTSPPLFFSSTFLLHRVSNPRKLNALKPLQRRLKPSQTPTNGKTTIISPS